MGLSPELSNAIGYGCGLLVSYSLNRKFTFRSQQGISGEMVRFLGVFLIAFTANLIVLTMLIRYFGVHAALSQVVAGLIYIALSYLMNKSFVFKTRAPHEN